PLIQNARGLPTRMFDAILRHKVPWRKLESRQELKYVDSRTPSAHRSLRMPFVQIVLRQQREAGLLKVLRRRFDVLDVQRKPRASGVARHQRISVVDADFGLQQRFAALQQALRSISQRHDE